MTHLDFARCPRRTAACPSPSHCPGPCEHGYAWMTSYDWRVTGDATGDNWRQVGDVAAEVVVKAAQKMRKAAE